MPVLQLLTQRVEVGCGAGGTGPTQLQLYGARDVIKNRAQPPLAHGIRRVPGPMARGRAHAQTPPLT